MAAQWLEHSVSSFAEEWREFGCYMDQFAFCRAALIEIPDMTDEGVIDKKTWLAFLDELDRAQVRIIIRA
ncbi:hypothetical protein TRAPUB_8151 [Trametes pubescens]|uniref:Uncharacterized protein n=1 Tax=Trametes pubescens TaxID=154538 RepID=A0A1M2W661_TRAPU|nr:hypothetical protein TRAPUB_8151 [Trametes pubescens]